MNWLVTWALLGFSWSIIGIEVSLFWVFIYTRHTHPSLAHCELWSFLYLVVISSFNAHYKCYYVHSCTRFTHISHCMNTLWLCLKACVVTLNLVNTTKLATNKQVFTDTHIFFKACWSFGYKTMNRNYKTKLKFWLFWTSA